ncbi:MAG: ATP-binding protein [Desulfovermiculus sp.]
MTSTNSRSQPDISQGQSSENRQDPWTIIQGLEMERQAAEERFQSLIMDNADGILILDSEHAVLFCNPAAEKILGRHFAELEGKLLGKLLLDQDEKAELDILHPDLTRRVVEARLAQTVWQKEPATVAMLRDITERRETEEQNIHRQYVETKLRELAQALLSPNSLAFISELVLEASKELTQSRYGFVGTIDPESGNLVSHTLSRSIWTTCQVPDKTIIFDAFKGLWGWVLTNQSPLMCNSPDQDPRSTGVPPGHIPIHNFLSVPVMLQNTLAGQIALANCEREYTPRDLDILNQLGMLFALAIQRQNFEDQLVKARDRAEAASQAKSQFLANMSHEIRTPLHGIVGVIQSLQGTELDNEQQELLHLCLRSAQRLTSLLSNILDLSSLEANRLEPRPEPFNLRDLLASLEEMFTPELRQKELEFTNSADSRLPQRLIGDSTRLTQILFNLLGNAIKYTQQGRVALRAEAGTAEGTRQEILFSVRDTGIGVPEELQQDVFDSFTQAEQSASPYSRNYDGAGLGLSLVQRLVKRLDGELILFSKRDEGTRIDVRLPFTLPEDTLEQKDNSTGNGL